MGTLQTIIVGVLLLSFLVFIHEGGHYVAARMFGVRVLEFFIGMPSSLRVSFVGKRTGTRFGVTAALLGGYARIAGMEPGEENPDLSLVLTLVNSRGTVTLEEVAYALQFDHQRAFDALSILVEWGSIIEREGTYLTQPRDKEGRTILDGALSRKNNGGKSVNPKDVLSEEGDPYFSPLSPKEFLDRERSRTYRGLSYPKRLLVLCGGVIVNLIFALVLFTVLLSISGTSEATNIIDSVVEDSVAEQAGVVSGDVIVEFNGVETPDWISIIEQLNTTEPGQEITLKLASGGAALGSTREITLIKPEEGTPVGIQSRVVHEDLTVWQAAGKSGEAALITLQAIVSLFNPATTKQVLDQSVSIVGIAVLAQDAAIAGLIPFLSIAAAISLSLGFMNLLPIPPLDGGKVVIETIQAVLKRPVSARVQTSLSFLGIMLFMGLFFYMLFQDTMRFLIGG